MAGQSIPLSDINAEFNENTEPRDDKLIVLLKQAYTHQINCQFAVIPQSLIKPFSDYKPRVRQPLIKKFITDYEANHTWDVLVYKEGNSYIMSDDYVSYYLYLRFRINEVLCTVLDPKPDPAIEFLGKPFKLPPPTFEVVE